MHTIGIHHVRSVSVEATKITPWRDGGGASIWRTLIIETDQGTVEVTLYADDAQKLDLEVTK